MNCELLALLQNIHYSSAEISCFSSGSGSSRGCSDDDVSISLFHHVHLENLGG